MKKWLYNIFLGSNSNVIWLVYLVAGLMLYDYTVGKIALIIGIPGILRLAFTMLYGLYNIILYLIPGKFTWKIISSDFSKWLEKKYQWMWTEPK
jgi:hypothetical protein